MKKSSKIILIICSVIIIVGLVFGYMMYSITSRSEGITGKKQEIPSVLGDTSSVLTGQADWPNWRGLNFDGKSTFTGIKTDWSNGLKKLWQIDYLCQGSSSATWSSPVVKGNRLIVMGRDEMNDVVFCLNAETSELIWKGSYAAEAASSSHGEGSRGTPSIDNGFVYTFGRSGDLVCWDLKNGTLIWKENVKDSGGQEPDWGFSTSPLVYDNKVIVQGGGNGLVMAFDKSNGKLVWKSMQGEAGYAAIIPVNIENETSLLVYHGKGLSLVNSENGKEFWNAPWETSYCVNASTPVVYQDMIFNTSGYKMGGEVLRFKRDGFTTLWKSGVIGAQHSDPILIDGYLYSYSGESTQKKGQFKCVEMLTGKEMWSTGEISQGTSTCVDGHLICMDISGNIYLVKPNPKSFELAGKIPKAMEDVKSAAWTVPVVANGKLYLRHLQHLVCYSLI
jgi:outer membrane protein assembly factor BamB